MDKQNSVLPTHATSDAVDFSEASEWEDIAYCSPTEDAIKRLSNWLQANPDRAIRLYHGTSASHSVNEEGLLPTTRGDTRRNSYQSRAGYVSLSIYPDMAKTFAKMSYPRSDVPVYAVEVPVRKLLADPDQLRNIRYWGDSDVPIGADLAASIAFGHGAQVRGTIHPCMIKESTLFRFNDPTARQCQEPEPEVDID